MDIVSLRPAPGHVQSARHISLAGHILFAVDVTVDAVIAPSDAVNGAGMFGQYLTPANIPAQPLQCLKKAAPPQYGITAATIMYRKGMRPS